MQRRDVLIGAGGIATATVGGAALFAGSAGASASGQVTEVENLSVTTDDGSVAWVAVGSSGSIDWEGLETPADTFDFDATITITDSDTGEAVVDGHVLASGSEKPIEDGFGRPDGSGDTGTRGTLEWEVPTPSNSDAENPTWLVVRNDALRNWTDGDKTLAAPKGSAGYQYADAVHAEDLAVDEDGASKTYGVEKTMTVTIRDENGDTVETDVSTTFELTVENIESGTTTESSGGVSAAGDPNKSE